MCVILKVGLMDGLCIEQSVELKPLWWDINVETFLSYVCCVAGLIANAQEIPPFTSLSLRENSVRYQ
jgi:hypothetical protein